MGFNQNKFLSPLFKLFGRKLANVPPFPVNLDIIQFNSTSNEWELVSGIIGSAVQSSSNVGLGAGWALPRVLDDLPFKSVLAGTGITLVVTPTTIEIINSGAMLNTFVLGYHADKNWKITTRFGAMFTDKQDQNVEADAQSVMGVAFTVRKITLFLSNNSSPAISTITLKRNGVAIPATTITIPAMTTGLFTVTGLSEVFSITDEIHEEHTIGAGGADNELSSNSYILEVEK